MYSLHVIKFSGSTQKYVYYVRDEESEVSENGASKLPLKFRLLECLFIISSRNSQSVAVVTVCEKIAFASSHLALAMQS